MLDATGAAISAPLADPKAAVRMAWAWPFAALALALAGGLGIDRATRTGIPHQDDLARISQTWTMPNAGSLSQTTVGPHNRAPTVGDEGFWLSRHDLAGSAVTVVNLGDRITIARKTGIQTGRGPAEPQVFEVVELKPLLEHGIQVSPVSHARGDAGSGARPALVPLTMVVCREVTTTAEAKPRIIRFVVDSAGAASVTPPEIPPVIPPVIPRTL